MVSIVKAQRQMLVSIHLSGGMVLDDGPSLLSQTSLQASSVTHNPRSVSPKRFQIQSS